jgi:hypothetical protein
MESVNVELSRRLCGLRVVITGGAAFITGIIAHGIPFGLSFFIRSSLFVQEEVGSAPASTPTLATILLLPPIGLWDQGEGHHVRLRHDSLLGLFVASLHHERCKSYEI